MSTINTNGINVNYPVPGVNNNSQGFRDNFTAIKTNLNTAGTEITDLQNKVVLKQALANTVLNNDMGNTLISNAATRSFRATTYNLGNALSGTVLVDVSLGDVQYGTIAGNTTFQFGSWAPTGTQSNVQLLLNVSNTSAVVTFPSEVVFANNNFGVTTLENYSNVGNVPSVSIPYGVSALDYRLSSADCGNTIIIEPINRPRITTQIQTRSPAPTGFPGDVSGTVAVDPGVNQLTLTSSNASDYFTTTGNTTQLYPGMAVVFTGTSFEANITSGTTYYVRNVVSSNTFTVSTTSNLASNVNLAGSTGNMYLNPVNYMYVATDDYNSTAITKSVTATVSTITLSGVTITGTAGQFGCTAASQALQVGQTITISGTFGNTGSITGYTDPTTYYIVATNGTTTFTLSTTLGGAGVTTTAGTPTGLTYTNKSDTVVIDNNTSLVVNSPIIFTGTTFGGLTANTVYYIKTIASPNITVSATRTNGVADTAVSLSTASGTCTATAYIGNDIWKRIPLNSW